MWLLHRVCILSFVVFVDQRREVRWEWQCLLAAAVRLGTEPTHTAATSSTRGTKPSSRQDVVVAWTPPVAGAEKLDRGGPRSPGVRDLVLQPLQKSGVD